jgi:shikimate kinase
MGLPGGLQIPKHPGQIHRVPKIAAPIFAKSFHRPYFPAKSPGRNPENLRRACRPQMGYPARMQQDRHIVNLALIGFMGTGKTSVGRLVAEQLHFEFLDTDELIQSRTGRTIADIFALDGEPAFRALEQQVVLELAGHKRTLVSTGGGLPTNSTNLAALKKHALVICLWASAEKVWERISHQAHRPLLNDPDPRKKIQELLAVREPFYKQADVLVNTDLRTMREVAQQVAHQYRFALSGH